MIQRQARNGIQSSECVKLLCTSARCCRLTNPCARLNVDKAYIFKLLAGPSRFKFHPSGSVLHRINSAERYKIWSTSPPQLKRQSCLVCWRRASRQPLPWWRAP